MKFSRHLLALVVLVSACTQAEIEQFFVELTPTAAIEITFLDVGQGDAILIRSPDGFTVLVDAGRGSRIMEILQEHGVRSIDLTEW